MLGGGAVAKASAPGVEGGFDLGAREGRREEVDELGEATAPLAVDPDGV